MITPYLFNNENLKIGFKLILANHNLNQANFILTMPPFYPHFGIETKNMNTLSKDMATIHARRINQ